MRSTVLPAWVLAFACLGSGCGSGQDDSVPVPPSYDALDPEVAQAIRTGVEAARAHAGDAGPLLELGLAYEANDLAEVAAQTYALLTERAPADPRGWFRLAVARARMGDMEGAAAAMQRSCDLDPASAVARARLGNWRLDLGDVAEGRALLERAAQLDPALADAWLGLARAHLEQDEGDAAVAVLSGHGLAQGRNAAYARQLLGTAYRQLGRLDEAKQVLADSAGASPLWTDPGERDLASRRVGASARRIAASNLLSAGRTDEAIALFRELLAREPDDADLASNLAAAYLKGQRVLEATDVLERALSASPRHHGLNLNLAIALVRKPGSTQADRERALLCLSAAEEARTGDARVAATRADVLRALGRLDEAVTAYRAADALDPQTVQHLLEAGMVEAGMGRRVEAEATFGEVLRRDARVGRAHLALAMLCAEEGRVPEARDHLTRAQETGNADPRLLAAVQQRLDASGAGR